MRFEGQSNTVFVGQNSGAPYREIDPRELSGGILGKSSNAPVPQHEIPERIARLQRGVESLSSVVAKLAERLSPVLRPLPPVNKSDALGSVTELGDSLETLAAKLQCIEIGVRDIHEALEL